MLAAWQVSGRPGSWDECAEGPCKCRSEMRSLSCWSAGLADLPPSQLVPHDVLKMQVFYLSLSLPFSTAYNT